MISRVTLKIYGIAVPPEISVKQYQQLNAILIFAVICSVLDILVSAFYSIFIPNTKYPAHDPTREFLFSGSTIFVLLVAWILTARFGIRFPGFAILAGFIGGGLKLEQLVWNTFVFDEVADPYSRHISFW